MSIGGVKLPYGEEFSSTPRSSGSTGAITTVTNIDRPFDYIDNPGPYDVWVELWDENNTVKMLETLKLQYVFN